MKKLFFALATSLLIFMACNKAETFTRDRFIGNYSIIITDPDGNTVNRPNQICNITASPTDNYIFLDSLLFDDNTRLIAKIDLNSLVISDQLITNGYLLSGTGMMDLDDKISIYYRANYSYNYTATLKKI